MVSPSKPTRVGGTDPLKVADVRIHTSAEWQADDPYEVSVQLNRATDDFEARVFQKEFGHYRKNLQLEYDSIRVAAEVGAIDPKLIVEFLDNFNARVAQRREEATSARERLRARGQTLLDALRISDQG